MREIEHVFVDFVIDPSCWDSCLLLFLKVVL